MKQYIDPAEGELCRIQIEDVEFSEEWSNEVSALNNNRTMPIIVRETVTGYALQDGFGRVSGLLNGGARVVSAIIVSADDLEERDGANDDQNWVEMLYAKYTKFACPKSTN